MTPLQYQHCHAAALAGFFCLCLAIFALFQRKVRVNLLFAAYNVSNAFWNSGDIVFLFDRGTGNLEWILRITGIGGCLFIPFVVHFGYEVLGIANDKTPRATLKALYFIGAIFSLLHQTPLLHTTALQGYRDTFGYWSRPGPLFPAFSIYLLVGLLLLCVPIPACLRNGVGIRKKQTRYLLLACILGAIAVAFFLASFFSFDFPWIYYGIQMIVGFIFAYTIFAHHLISITVALRRAGLLVGILSMLSIVILPLALRAHELMLTYEPVSIGVFLGTILVFGCLMSIAPIAYLAMVRRSDFFNENTLWHLTHELKTPLASIQSARTIIEEEIGKNGGDNQKTNSYLGMIDRNAARLEQTVQEILDYGRANRKIYNSHKTSVDLVKVIQESFRLFPAETHRLILLRSKSVVVCGVEEGLRQIITNLLSNSVKFSKEGSIEIEISENDTHVLVSVKDYGEGFAKDTHSNLFQPFSQLDNASRVKGSGLGLAIARAWVEAHGGQIWAESAGPGKGMMVTFTLMNSAYKPPKK